MSRRIFILGSTGSIGRSAIEVIEHLRSIDGADSWPVIGLAAGTNGTLLKKQAARLSAESVSIEHAEGFDYPFVYSNAVELLQSHAQPGDLVVAAIVGFAGILPVLTAIECGCDIALANKETLVAGGELVMNAINSAGVQLLPVDSEHSAIFQAIASHPMNEVAKITITASGGSLRMLPENELHDVTVDQVLDHPTWTMGAKVTVDSASLMNKALELIEAHWLFGVGSERLDAVIHRQSIVHGMVEFCDGSVIAQLSPPDMKIPIQYALTWPKRRSGASLSVDWSKQQSLDFEPINCARYPAVRLAFDVMNQGGTSGAVFNAANEVVVEAFLEQSLPFGSMIAIVEEVLGNISISDHVTFDSVVKADSEARKQASALVASHKVNS